jgi:hypothetical protein
MNKKILKDDSGQVLLFVTVLLAITLGVGLSISYNTISGIQRTSQTDSFQKVTAAAEGGIEQFLVKSDSSLENDVNKTSKVDFGNIESNVNVKRYTIEQGSIIEFPNLNSTEVATIYFTNILSNTNTDTLNGLGGSVCLKMSHKPISNSSYLVNVYKKNPNLQPEPTTFYLDSVTQDLSNTNLYILEKYLFDSNGVPIGPNLPTACSPNATTNGYQYSAPILIRIQPVGATVNLEDFKVELRSLNPTSLNNTLKSITQGYVINSKANFKPGFGDGSSRTIEAIKFLDTPSYIFDYVGVIE